MGKKKTKVQKDLFGTNVKENPYQQTIYSIAKKFKSSEEPKKFDFGEWQDKVDKWATQGNKAKELECYDEIETAWGWDIPSYASLNKGIILVDFGRYEEAFQILDSLYGCESHDTIVASAQLQLARISAIQGKEEKVLFYLKEAFRTTLFFKGIASHYDSENLRKHIESVKEFDKYRNATEFQEVINFDWGREDIFELETKMRDYIRKKKINPKYIDPIRLHLIEFLCKYAESDVYLKFDVEAMWLVNPSKSILIIKRDIMTFLGNYKGEISEALFNFSQESLDSIESLYPQKKTYPFEKNTYSKEKVETVQKIIEGRADVHIFENLLLFKPLSYGRPMDNKSYRVYTKRRDNNYDVILFQQPLENISEFIAPNLTRNWMKLIVPLFKNYPENPIEKSKKENYDPDKYPKIDLIEEVRKFFSANMLNEVEQEENNQLKLKIVSDYIQNYIFDLTDEEKLIFSRAINDIVESMFKKASINQIHNLIMLPDNKLYKLLTSTKVGSNQFSYWIGTYFELIKNELDKHAGESVLLDVLLYFNRYTFRNKEVDQFLKREIKLQLMKGDIYAIRKVFGHLQRIPKSERIEMFSNINLDQSYKILPLDIERMNQRGSSRTSKEAILLFELLYTFSKFNVQSAQQLLNKELIANFSILKANSLEYTTKNKMFSFLSHAEVNKLCSTIDFKEIFSTLSFVKATQLLERFFKLGYKKARDTIKKQALNLALENNIKTDTKTFTKYVSEAELKDFLAKKKDNS